jgi:hypothetical protein
VKPLKCNKLAKIYLCALSYFSRTRKLKSLTLLKIP